MSEQPGGFELNKDTSLGINLKWLIQIILVAGAAVYGYFGLTSKISQIEIDVLRMKDSPPTILFINPLKKPPDIPDFISTLEDWATIAPGSTFNCSPLERFTVIIVNAGPNSNSCSISRWRNQSFLDSWGDECKQNRQNINHLRHILHSRC